MKYICKFHYFPRSRIKCFSLAMSTCRADIVIAADILPVHIYPQLRLHIAQLSSFLIYSQPFRFSRFLSKTFASLPAQALPSCLDGIKVTRAKGANEKFHYLISSGERVERCTGFVTKLVSFLRLEKIGSQILIFVVGPKNIGVLTGNILFFGIFTS